MSMSDDWVVLYEHRTKSIEPVSRLEKLGQCSIV
jgi:hypothetical protein